MYKRILVPIDPSESSKKALDLAIYLAKQHDAEVTGLVVLDQKGIDDYIGPLPIGASKYAHELEHLFVSEAKKVIAELSEMFEQKCAETSIKYTMHKLKGMPGTLIIEESRFYDLMVMGRQSNFNFAINEEKGRTFEKVMSNCLSPILAVPEDLDVTIITEGNPSVLIALDGSLEASGALVRFAQLVSDQTSVVNLVMSHEDEYFANYILSNSADLLDRYGLKEVNTHYTEKNIIKYIDENFLDSTHLFVMGPRTSNALSSFFLGSFTKYLLKNSKQLLFIAK